jgi:hypothetical protein
MNRNFRLRSAFLLSFVALSAALFAQQAKPGVLTAEEIKRVVPTSYFYRGQSAMVQVRNSGGFSTDAGKLVLAGLVDTSGYSSDVSAKYQGFLITEVSLNIEGTELKPGQYGFGFSKDGKFQVMDVGANDLFSVSSRTDDELQRPVPLKIEEDRDSYRLYAGRRWVSLKPE